MKLEKYAPLYASIRSDQKKRLIKNHIKVSPWLREIIDERFPPEEYPV